MPALIIPVVASVASSAVGGGVLGALAAGAVAFGASKLMPKPKVPNTAAEASGITSMNRSTTDSLRVIYGERRVSGTMAFIHTTNSTTYGAGQTYTKTNAALHMVLVMAGHEVDSIGDIYFEDERIAIDGNGEATASKWKNKKGMACVRVKKFTGVNNNTAFNDLRADCPLWTSQHQLEGLSGVYVRLIFDGDVFPNGIPNVSALVKGKKVFDPRNNQTAWSDNFALCMRDYISDSRYGLNAQAQEIDDNSFMAAANICDELVEMKAGGTQKRYTCNGVVDCEKKPIDILQEMNTAGHAVLTYVGGLFALNVGAYSQPVATITESWFADGVSVETRPSRSELFNAVKGVFADPAKNYQPTDFPPVTNALYEAEDTFREYRDIELPFTTDMEAAQRIAKMTLEESRQSIRFNSTFNLNAYQLSIEDRVYVNLPDFGWDNKVFKVEALELTPEAEVSMSLKEDASGVYDWVKGEATTVDLAPNTTLPNPVTAEIPQNVTVSSGNDSLYMNLDGTIMSRVHIKWDEADDAFTKRFEVATKPSASDVWTTSVYIPAQGNEKPEHYILDVQDGESHDIRVRSINAMGVNSEWVEVLEHIVVGKTAPPSDVAKLGVQQGRGTVTFLWDEVQDADLSGYEIRYGKSGTPWENANSLTRKTKGTHVTSAAVPPGTWTFYIKAFDTSGNESVNAATFTSAIDNDYDVIHTEHHAPVWPGNVQGFVRNPLTGDLIPKAKGVCADYGWEMFDTVNPDPVDACSYETLVHDIGFDSQVRVYTEIEHALLPNNTGHATLNAELSSKKSGESFSDYSKHTVGEITAKELKFKLTHQPKNDATAVIKNFNPVLDQQEFVQSGTLTIDNTGVATVNFDKQYHKNPRIILTAEGDGVSGRQPVYLNVTTTGFGVELYDAAGTSKVAGAVTWEAKGV